MIAALAAATFLAGFGVAELTDVRVLGGLVLVAGGVLCARLALPVAGGPRTLALLALALGLFAAAHPLGEAIGAWPAVLVAAAAVAAAAALLVRPSAA